jgi:D-alanyl-D-alanine endopeptidase (penicillin-binding protein 7)
MRTKSPVLSWFLLACTLAAGGAQAADEMQTALTDSSTGKLSRASARLWTQLDPSRLRLQSHHVLVMDRFGNEVYAKGADQAVPIASITKLMTAIVTLDAHLNPNERIKITSQDRDLVKHTSSRLGVGGTLTREELLQIALMSSENRAASALARTYPGGREAFVRAMNRKAKELGMRHSRFVDSTGLDERNTSTARDLARLVRAAEHYPLIGRATTTQHAEVRPYSHRGPLAYRNTNRLVGKENWRIGLSKTGFINEAGRCLVMSVEITRQPLVFIFLDAPGKLSPLGDSNRLRSWIEAAAARHSPS